MSNNSLIEVQDVEYRYETRESEAAPAVLRGVSLTVQAGEMVCLMGPSGSGKTTLLNLMGLLEKPQVGDIRFIGQSVKGLSESALETHRLRDLGFIFQAFFLIPTLSVLDNTTYFLGPLGMGAREAKERATEVLEKVGLQDHLSKYPRELSGGQRQRVAVARAVAKKPKVILADEPTANLDRATAEKIVSVFQELRDNEGTSFVFSTHDQDLLGYAQSVYRLQDGKVVR
ncbi:MAG: ABC transporter ATP-binding protein [Bdellovibrionales bacterium]|nr:ABC transporter ATP-binding protein [Bdellovibrionales bacterium]